jgi:hypothetical protein
MNARQKKAGLQTMQASSVGFMPYVNLVTDSNNDDGGGDNSGARWTSSMTAQSNSGTDKIGSIHMDNSCSRCSRTGNNRIGTPDIRTLLRLRQRQS